MGRGWRHRFYATGLPGWARYGYAPAWGAPPASGYGPGYGPDYGPYAAEPSREEEADALRQQAEWLKQQLDAIGQRIEELATEE